jgi:hypothetical protein
MSKLIHQFSDMIHSHTTGLIKKKVAGGQSSRERRSTYND